MARTALALSSVPERVSVLETKVDNIESKLDDLKSDVKEMHDCLDKTRDGISDKLEAMQVASTSQHKELAGKIKDLEAIKTKWTYMIAGAVAAAGWLSGHSDKLLSLLK